MTYEFLCITLLLIILQQYKVDIFSLICFTEAVLPQLLHALCAGPETPIQHLEQQQVRDTD